MSDDGYYFRGTDGRVQGPFSKTSFEMLQRSGKLVAGARPLASLPLSLVLHRSGRARALRGSSRARHHRETARPRARARALSRAARARPPAALGAGMKVWRQSAGAAFKVTLERKFAGDKARGKGPPREPPRGSARAGAPRSPALAAPRRAARGSDGIRIALSLPLSLPLSLSLSLSPSLSLSLSLSFFSLSLSIYIYIYVYIM